MSIVVPVQRMRDMDSKPGVVIPVWVMPGYSFTLRPDNMKALQALGWEVVSIPFYEWPHGEMARKEYLELVLLGQGVDIRS